MNKVFEIREHGENTEPVTSDALVHFAIETRDKVFEHSAKMGTEIEFAKAVFVTGHLSLKLF